MSFTEGTERTAWFSTDEGGSWENGGANWHHAFEIKANPIDGCNWDNGIVPNGVNARAISPPTFPRCWETVFSFSRCCST